MAETRECSLSMNEVRQVLRECVTVVRPGEVLVIRVSENFTPNQLREYNNSVKSWLEYNAPGVRVLVTPGEELGIAEDCGTINGARAAMGLPPWEPPL